MARRNNLTLEEIVEKANNILLRSTCDPKQRQGVCSLTESILSMADNYGGFRYLDATEVPPGQLPGIIPGETNGERDNTKNQYPDETRRQYSLKKYNDNNLAKAKKQREVEFPIFFCMELPNTAANEPSGHNKIVGRFSVRDTAEELQTIASVQRIYPNAVQTLRKEV